MPEMTMLARRKVLILEDEALVACDLAFAVEEADGQPVGPFATVKDGLVYLATNEVEAAILDVHLADRDVTPVAIHLLERRKVVVFHTASDIPLEVAERFGALPICRKPMPSRSVVIHLATIIGELSSSAGARVNREPS